MHRMRQHVTKAGLTFFFALFFGSQTSADVIQSPGGMTYPEIVGGIDGTQNFVFDPGSQTGTFQVTTTPFLLKIGPSSSDDVNVTPDGDGIHSQVLNLKLDSNGHLVTDPGNSYALYGTVSVGGQTYSGLLLRATPTTFGTSGGATSGFNLDLKVTGGALATQIGPELFLSILPTAGATFDGNFAKNFSIAIDRVKAWSLNPPPPIPEPTTLMVLLAGAAGLLIRRRVRISGADLDD